MPCLGDLSLLRRAVEQRAVVGVAAAAHDQAPDPRVGKNPGFLYKKTSPVFFFCFYGFFFFFFFFYPEERDFSVFQFQEYF